MAKLPATRKAPVRRFNPQAFLASTGVARKLADYRKGDLVFAQGDPCKHVFYLQKGGVKLSVLS